MDEKEAADVTEEDFSASSHIQLTNLSKLQIDNIFLLGRIWGFLKYYQPEVTAGKRNWDFELFRILPKIIGAPSHEVARRLLDSWIVGLGPIQPCHPCVEIDPRGQQHKVEMDWIYDSGVIGPPLSKRLPEIYTNRNAVQQYYVSLKPGVGSPIFEHESNYADVQFPDPGFQLLALFRFWNAVEYWYPYGDLIENWDRELRSYIAPIMQSTNRTDYDLLFMKLIALLHDSHANLWSALSERPPVGKCRLAATMRFIDGRPVVSGLAIRRDEQSSLALGDVLLKIDGILVSDLVSPIRQYYGASNDGSQLRDIANSLGRGNCGTADITVWRDDEELMVRSPRVPISAENSREQTEARQQQSSAFTLLTPSVAYLKVSAAGVGEIQGDLIDRASHTKGLILDLRGYPKDFVVFALGDLLVQKRTAFARFTHAHLESPGAFYWTDPVELSPGSAHYDGQVRVLVDETTQSQAEYTALALRVAPNSKMIGSTTAGADGNVSRLPLPFGGWTLFSGIGVFYPDNHPTQRVGITPDIVTVPSVEGIRAGRDEVLEAAIRSILGSEVTESEITHIANQVKRESSE